MFVLTAVSSRNTSRAGSSKPCSRIQRRRAWATSARCCSAARRLFFKGDVMTVKEPPECAPTASDSPLAQCCEDFIQSGVRLFVNKGQYHCRMLLQPRCAPPARFRRRTATIVPALHPLDRRTRGDLENLRRSAPRRPGYHRFDQTLSQITRIGFRHCPALKRKNQCRQTRSSTTLCESSRFKSTGKCSNLLLTSRPTLIPPLDSFFRNRSERILSAPYTPN